MASPGVIELQNLADKTPPSGPPSQQLQTLQQDRELVHYNDDPRVSDGGECTHQIANRHQEWVQGLAQH